METTKGLECTLLRGANDPIQRNKLFVSKPFAGERDAFDFTPYVWARMVEHDDLKPSFCAHDLFAERLEDRADRDYVLVACATALARMFDVEAARKINLAWLVKNQQARHRMRDLRQEEALEREHDCDMIGEPISAAADLPEIVSAVGMDNADCEILDRNLDWCVGPLCV